MRTKRLEVEVPATPGGSLPLRNSRSLAYVPTPRTSVGRASATLRLGQYQGARASQGNVPANPVRRFSRPHPGITSQIGQPLVDHNLGVSGPLQRKIEGLFPRVLVLSTRLLIATAISEATPNLSQMTRNTAAQYYTDIPKTLSTFTRPVVSVSAKDNVQGNSHRQHLL